MHPVSLTQYREERRSFRILEWVRVLSERGYTHEQWEKDVDGALAVCFIMVAEGESDHMNRILRTYMERITAGQLMGISSCNRPT